MNATTTVNANFAECLRTISHFGFSRVHNVCNGTTTDIPWGAFDWALAVGGCTLGAAMVAMVLALVVMIIRD